MTNTNSYCQMQKEFYKKLALQSNYVPGEFFEKNDVEYVVGHYAMHEDYDYEGPLLGKISKTEQMLALEYGCGPGRMLLRLANRFRRIDGVDLSSEVLEVAKYHCQALETPPNLFHNNGIELPMIDDGTYDLAYSVICLQHICVHSIRKKIISEIHRILKPTGTFTFQMGYGFGHPQTTPYEHDFISAEGTNGMNDVMVLHPWEPIKTLFDIGFNDIRFSLQPVCPDDSHSAWIFLQAQKTLSNKISIQNGTKNFSPVRLMSDFAYCKKIFSQMSINQKLADVHTELVNC